MLSVRHMTGRAGTDILIRPFLQIRNGIHHAASKLSIPRAGAVKPVLFHRSRREAKESRSLARTQISEWWGFQSHCKHPSDKRRIGAPDSTHLLSQHLPMAALRLEAGRSATGCAVAESVIPLSANSHPPHILALSVETPSGAGCITPDVHQGHRWRSKREKPYRLDHGAHAQALDGALAMDLDRTDAEA